MRESGLAFFSSLSIHSLAMALVVGINVAISLRLLTTNAPAPGLAKLYPLHWLGVGIIFLSGVALLLAYPAKALTNPVFYAKLAALVTGLIIAFKIQNRLIKNSVSGHWLSTKNLAALALFCWIITIFTGRFLAYTNSILLASRLY